MRLSAAILSLVSLVLMACAAYLPAGLWQRALYADVVSWTLAVLLLVLVLIENLARSPAWARAALALVGAAGALVFSAFDPPGKLTTMPFHELGRNAASVASLAGAVAAIWLGGAAVRLDKRGPNVVAAISMLIAVVAMLGWLHA